MIKKPRNISLRAGELADAYALKTLYNELKSIFPNDHLYFSLAPRSGIPPEIFEGYPVLKHGIIQPDYELNKSKPSMVIMVRSDTTEDLPRLEGGKYRTLCIDASLLKAMRPLPSNERCHEIKERYKLDGIERPLITLGWLGYYNKSIETVSKQKKRQTEKLISLLAERAHLITTPGRCNDSSLETYDLSRETLSNITDVPGWGHLADLYAVSDVALSWANFWKCGGNLNNFYEQTQGAPFFLVPTKNAKQYGYNEFVGQGLVRPCKDLEEITQKIIEFLDELGNNPQIKENHRQKWITHREKTRENYIPKISERIDWILNSGRKSEVFTYVHPESDWGDVDFTDDFTEIFEDSYKSKLKGDVKLRSAA